MDKENIAILYGGMSEEHEVSLKSAASIEEHIDKARYSTILIGITQDGIWYLQKNKEVYKAGTPLCILENENRIVTIIPGKGFFANGLKLGIDFIIPILHGTFGEDGTIQGLLEIIGLPYAGAGVLGSAVGMDKEKSKLLWKAEGLPVVPFISIGKREYFADEAIRKDIINKAFKKFGLPLFVKPAGTGSSVGVSRIDELKEVDKAIRSSFLYDMKVLIEPCINGKEIECSVIGNASPIACTPGEIIPGNGFYDYEAKYIDPDGTILLIPADITEEQIIGIKEIAINAYKICDADGMARVDFFIENETGEILLNEINTIPGFTELSMFPRMCETSGIKYSELIEKLVYLGKERFNDRRKLLYSYKG